MKPFRFTLQALLTVRAHAEQQAKEQFAQTIQAQHHAEQQQRSLDSQAASLWRQWRESYVTPLGAEELQRLQAYDQWLGARRREAQQLTARARQAALVQQNLYLAARRQREIVEKARERQWLSYHRAARQAEQKTLDDLAGRRPLPLADSARPAPGGATPSNL